MSKMKFEFQGLISNSSFYDKTSSKTVVMELNDDDLTIPEVLNEFQNFLRAVGYNFPDGAELEVSHREDNWDDWGNTDDWDDSNSGTAGSSDYKESVDLHTESKYNFSDEEITAEVIRIRDSTPGLSEEAYEMAAWHSLSKKADEGV